VDFVEICNVCAKKAIIKAAKRIINSDTMCRCYSDLNFGVTFFGTQCIIVMCGNNVSVTAIFLLVNCITFFQFLLQLQLFLFFSYYYSYI